MIASAGRFGINLMLQNLILPLLGFDFEDNGYQAPSDNGDEIVSLKINVNTVGETSLLSLRPERVWVNVDEKK